MARYVPLNSGASVDALTTQTGLGRPLLTALAKAGRVRKTKRSPLIPGKAFGVDPKYLDELVDRNLMLRKRNAYGFTDEGRSAVLRLAPYTAELLSKQ